MAPLERKRKSFEPLQVTNTSNQEVVQPFGCQGVNELQCVRKQKLSPPVKRSERSSTVEKQYVLPDKLFPLPPPPPVPPKSTSLPTANTKDDITPIVTEPNLGGYLSRELGKENEPAVENWSVFDVSSGLATELFPKRESDICLIEGEKENSLTQFPHLVLSSPKSASQPYRTKAFQEWVTFENSREKLPAHLAGDQLASDEDFTLSEQSYSVSTDCETDEKVTYIHFPSPVPDFPSPKERRIKIELPKDIPSETSITTEITYMSKLSSARCEEPDFPLSCTEAPGLCQSWIGCFSVRKGLRWRKCNVVFEDDYLEISAASLKGHERSLLRYPVSNFSVRTKNNLKCGPGHGSILILSSPNLPEISLRVFDNSIKCEFLCFVEDLMPRRRINS